MPPAASSELSLLAQQLDEFCGGSSSRKRTGRTARVTTEIQEKEGGAPGGLRVAARRQLECASTVRVAGRSRSNGRRISSTTPVAYGDVSSRVLSDEEPKWTETSVLRFFSSHRSKDKESPAAAERENGSADTSFATAADLRLVREAAAAAAERCLPAEAGAARALSPCLAPYYSPVLHPFWIAQQDKAADEVEEDEADESELEEEDYMGSFNDVTSSVPGLRAPDDINTAGGIRANLRARGRSSSRRRNFLSAHRAAARSRRRCKSQRELLQQELPQQSPEAAAAAAAALLSCNSFNSYRIASVVPPAPGRGTWTDETNLGELVPLLLPEQYERQREEQQQLQQMLLPLQQERQAKFQSAIRDLMQQEQQMSLLPQEIFDLGAFPAAAEQSAAGAAAAPVDLAAQGENEKPLQLPLTTEELLALLQGKSTNAPGGAGGTLNSNISGSSMPADLSFQRRSEEEAAARGRASADVCNKWRDNKSGVLSRAFVSASFAAAAATAEAEAERVATQPLAGTLQQRQLKVRFEQQQLLDEELEQLPIAVSSSHLSPAAAGAAEGTRLPAFAFAATDDVSAAARDTAKETESEASEEFPFTSRTPVAATLAAEAAAADAAGAAKREAAILSAACDAMGRVKLQQVWGAAAAEQQQMRLLKELQHQQKQQKLIEAEVKAIDGLQQELDTWQADLAHQHDSMLHQDAQQQQHLEQQRQPQLVQRQQLTRQQQIVDVTFQHLQPVEKQQDPLMEVQHLLEEEVKPGISLVQETSQDQQERNTLILVPQDDTVSPAFRHPVAAARDSAPVAADSVSSYAAAAAATDLPATTTVVHGAARAAAVFPTAVAGAPCHVAITGAAPPRTVASAFTAATRPAAAAAAFPVASGKQDRQQPSSEPSQTHSDTERSLTAAISSRRSRSAAAGVAIASSGDMPQVHDTGASAPAAASHVIIMSTLQRSSSPTDMFSSSKQQQQQQQQQHKPLHHHHDFRQGQVETQQMPLLLQQQARSEEARDVSLTAGRKTPPQVDVVAATDTGRPPAHDAVHYDVGGILVPARYDSKFPASDASKATAIFDAAGVPLVTVAAPSAASSGLAAPVRAAGAAMTGPSAVVAAPELASAVVTASAVRGATDTPAAAGTTPSPSSSSSPCVKLVVKRPQQQEPPQQQQQQRSQQSQPQLPQQQLQPRSLQKQQPHRREEQQYVLRQQPLQQTARKTMNFPTKIKSQTPQTITTAVMPGGVYASEASCTLPSDGRVNSSRTTATTVPAVGPAVATVIRKWRIINGVATPVLQTLPPAFIGAGTAATVGPPYATARTAPPSLVPRAATKAAATTAAKPLPVKKASLFEKLRLLLGGGSSSSCTECVCSSGAASTTGRGRENEQQNVKGMSVCAAPPPPVWLPEDQLGQAMQWQLPYQQHVQRQQQRQNTMVSRVLNGEKGYNYPSSSSLAAADADTRRPVPLSHRSVLLPAATTLPTAHNAVELHVAQCTLEKQSKEEIQPYTPCEVVPQELVWQQQQEGRLVIPAASYVHANVSTRGAATRPAAVASSAPPQVPIYIPVVDPAVTAADQASLPRMAGLQQSLAAAGGHQLYRPAAFASPSPSAPAAAAAAAPKHRLSDASAHPTATAASSAGLAASAAPAIFEPEQQQQQQECQWRSNALLAVQHSQDPELPSYPSVSLSKDKWSQWREVVQLQERDNATVQPDWERQQQIAFQQQLQHRRRQQGIYSKPAPGELQQQICLPEDRQREAKPYLLSTGLSSGEGTAGKQSNQDYQSTVTPLVSSATARASSRPSRLSFGDLEEERFFQTDGGKHKVAETPLSRGRNNIPEQQWTRGDAAKKSRSKVPDNWIRFGAEAATTEEDTDAAAAAGHTAAGLIATGLTAAGDTAATSEAWMSRNQRRQRRCPDDIKKRWLQQHPEHQSAAAFDIEFAEHQRQQQLQVIEDKTEVHSEPVQRLLQQRRLLQQQRQRLLKQQRQRSTRELEPKPVEVVSRAELQQQLSCTTGDNTPQQQLRKQQLRQQEQARQRLQHRQQQQQGREQQRSQQKQRLRREHLQDREDNGVKEQELDTEKICVYPVASAAPAVKSPTAAVGAEGEEERASPTTRIEFEQPMANEEATSSPQWSRSRKSSSRNSRLDSRELLLLQQRQQGEMDNNGNSSAPVVAAVSSEEAESATAALPTEAVAEAPVEARAGVDKQMTPTLNEAESVRAEKAAATLGATDTASDRRKEAEQRRQERACEAHETAAAAAAAHIAAIAATKAARAADTAIAVLAAATVGTPLDVYTLQQQQHQQRHMLDQCVGADNDLSLLASKQLPVRHIRSKKSEREETIMPEVERKGYADGAFARAAEAAVDAAAVGGAQMSERHGSLRAQSYRSLSVAPAAAAQVESVRPAAVRENKANGYEGGVGNPKAAAAATAAAAAAAAEAAREAARRAAANIQEVAAVVAEPLQPLQQLFSFCTGGSSTASRRAATDKKEVLAVANSACRPAYSYSFEGAPSSVQQPIVLRYWYNTPAQLQQEGDEKQQQVRSYYYASPVMRPGEPPSTVCQQAAAALEAPTTNEGKLSHREADAASWRPRSVTRRKRGIQAKALYDYPLHTHQGLYAAAPQTVPEELYN